MFLMRLELIIFFKINTVNNFKVNFHKILVTFKKKTRQIFKQHKAKIPCNANLNFVPCIHSFTLPCQN